MKANVALPTNLILGRGNVPCNIKIFIYFLKTPTIQSIGPRQPNTTKIGGAWKTFGKLNFEYQIFNIESPSVHLFNLHYLAD